MSLRALGVCGAALALSACDPVGDPRPQLLVQIDTDAPLLFHALDQPAVAPVAVVDTLRIDVVSEDNEILEARAFLVVDRLDWPLSLGVANAGGQAGVRLRLRLFNGDNATSEQVLGSNIAQPHNGAAIDRLAELSPPTDGIERVHVTLSFDCMGALVSFAAGGSTCIDADRTERPPSEGVQSASELSLVGTSTTPREVPCNASHEGAICIPGGFTFMGDPRAANQGTLSEDARPMRPVALSPFLMDATEVTVGAFRAAWQSLGVAEPNAPSSLAEHCTWLGPNDASNDALPLNCVPFDSAAAFCAHLGGTLPTEAQYEHAARGRGRGYAYPWGNRAPECCTASHGRFPIGGVASCGATGPEPPGSHPAAPACSGLGDVSIDGVLDLAGSMRETTRDRLAPYDAPCWSSKQGVLRDPLCADAEATVPTMRGGSWGAGAKHLHATLRRPHEAHIDTGFRCVYPVAGEDR